jgi:GNAT superfamily N-acetyltransferase
MDVRPARLEDAWQIAVIHVRSWQEAYRGLLPQEFLDRLDPAQRVDSWRRDLEPPGPIRSGTLVIGSGDALAGFVNFGPTRDEDDDPARVGEIRAIYLLSRRWGQGLGRDLMAAALDRLSAAGFEQAILWVLDSNARARRFYEAGGWSADGAVKDDDRPGLVLNEVRYRRPLP